MVIEIIILTKSDLVNFKHKIQESLESLKRKSIYALLIHRENDILKPGFEELYNHLLELKMNGTVKKIGFSSYEPEIAEKILKEINLDIVQVPLNTVVFEIHVPANAAVADGKKHDLCENSNLEPSSSLLVNENL